MNKLKECWDELVKKYGDKVRMGCVQERPYVQHPQAKPAYISLHVVFREIIH